MAISISMVKSASGIASSRYPAGNAPALGALTKYGTPRHGVRVALKTNGTYGFGSTGPNVAFKSNLLNSSNGSRWNNDYVGNGIVAAGTKPNIIASASMPYGKAAVCGAATAWAVNKSPADLDGNIIVRNPTSSQKIFVHYNERWDTANQLNAKALLDTGLGASAAWQLKSCWFGDSAGGTIPTFNASSIDIYTQTYQYDKTLNTWNPGTFQSSNSIGVIYKGPEPYKTGTNSFSNAPLIVQKYAKGGLAYADSNYKNFIAGTGLSTSYRMPSGNTAGASLNFGSSMTFDRCHMMGFCYGFNIPDNCFTEFGDIYMAFGNGAPARVELTDNQTYSSITNLTVGYVARAEWWSADSIDVILQAGPWYVDGTESLSGLWLHVWDMDNNYIGAVQL